MNHSLHQLITGLLLSAPLFLQAQKQDTLRYWQKTETDTVTGKVYEQFWIERHPTFPGGDAALLQFLQQHIHYPALAMEHQVEGTVVVTFEIAKDGAIKNIQIKKDIGAHCGQAVAGAIAAMPRWIPPEMAGNPPWVTYTLPVVFRLQN